MPPQQINRHNLGIQICTARTLTNLTRIQLAKHSGIAHNTVKLAEEGSSATPDDALAKICRALEDLGLEFPNGTWTTTLILHSREDMAFFGMTADSSMPGWVRRIYPRTLDSNAFFHDLDACGIHIDNLQYLLGICQTNPAPWPETFAQIVQEGRKFGVRLTWRNGIENVQGVHHIVKPYNLSLNVLNTILSNISITN